MQDQCFKSLCGLLADSNKKYERAFKFSEESKNIFERYLEMQQSESTENNQLRAAGADGQNVRVNRLKKNISSFKNRSTMKNKRRNRVFISLDSYTAAVDVPVETPIGGEFNESKRLQIRLLGVNSIRPIGIRKTLAHILHEKYEQEENEVKTSQEEEVFQQNLHIAHEQQQRVADISGSVHNSSTNPDVNMNVDLDDGVEENNSFAFGSDLEDEEEGEEGEEVEQSRHEHSGFELSSINGHMVSGHTLDSNLPDLSHEFDSFARNSSSDESDNEHRQQQENIRVLEVTRGEIRSEPNSEF